MDQWQNPAFWKIQSIPTFDYQRHGWQEVMLFYFFSIIYKFFLANFHFQLHANIWAVSFSKFWNCAAYQVSPILGQISRLDKIGLSAHITCTVSRRKMQKAPPENPNPKRFPWRQFWISAFVLIQILDFFWGYNLGGATLVSPPDCGK